MKWSLNQSNVINLIKGDLLVSASAGSGKTAVLTERIINLILNYGVSINEILIITFTNAAASEMSERILKNLELRVNEDNKDFLEEQIFLISNSNIQTFHSFCLDVLKNNYYKLNLDSNIKILKDSQRKIMIDEVIEEVFSNYYNEKNENFISVVNKYGGKYSDEKLREFIIQIYNFILTKPNIDEFREDILKIYNFENQEIFKTKWGAYLKEEYILEISKIRNLIEDFKYGICFSDKEEEIIFEDLKIINDFVLSLEDDYEKCRRFINSIKFKRAPSKASEYFEEYKSIRGKLKKFFEDLKKKIFFKSLDEVFKNIVDLREIINILLEITYKFKEEFDLKKRSQSLIDFNDMEHLTLKLLEDESVRENLKNKFKYIFIDEYQDTNYIQEYLVNKIKREDSPNVFMVGDIKQSIYSFRGAKVDLFHEKYKNYNTLTSLDNSNNFKNKILLYDNYRSEKEVIDFINFIFKNTMVEGVSNLIYTNEENLNYMGNRENLNSQNIKIGIIDKNFKNSDENIDDGEVDESECNLIVKYIKDLVSYENPQEIFDKDLNDYRKIEYRDIVILMRNVKASSKSSALEEILIKNNIPTYFDGGETFFDSIEVMVVLSLLKVIDNPLDDLELLTVLRSEIFNFSENNLGYLRIIDKNNFIYKNIKNILNLNFENSEIICLNEDFCIDKNEFVDLYEKCRNFLEKMDLYRRKSKFMKIDDFIWFLYMDTNYYFSVSIMDNGVKRQNNLKLIFNKAKEFRLSNFSGLFSFIEYLKNSKKSGEDILVPKNISKNENVVRIMSIHKSKGLEFPVVILCNTSGAFNMRNINAQMVLDDDFGIGINHIDYEKNLETPSLIKMAIKHKLRKNVISEELRILYVALTRAKDRLYITGVLKDKNFFERIYDVKKCKSYLEFISSCLINHVEGKYFRDKCESYKINTLSDECLLSIEIFDYNEFLNSENENKESKDLNHLKEILNKERNSDYIDKIINFDYKFKNYINTPINVSVSEILSYGKNYDEKIAFKKPNFLNEESKKIYTSLDIGNLYHLFMQNINLNSNINSDYIDFEINRMRNLNILENEDLKYLNKHKILNFFNTNLGKRLIKAFENGNKIHREFEFLLKHRVSKICDYEDIRIQGIIDLFFFEEDKIILVDYKTDKMIFKEDKTLISKYKEQLYYYKIALEKIFNLEVLEKYIYSFELSKEIMV